MCAPVLLLYKLITIAHRCASRSKLPSRVAPHPCLLGSRGLLTRHDCVRGGRMYCRRWAPLRARKFWLATNSEMDFHEESREGVCPSGQVFRTQIFLASDSGSTIRNMVLRIRRTILFPITGHPNPLSEDPPAPRHPTYRHQCGFASLIVEAFYIRTAPK